MRALHDSRLVGQLRLRRIRPTGMGSGSCGSPIATGPLWEIHTHAATPAEHRAWLASLGVEPWRYRDA